MGLPQEQAQDELREAVARAALLLRQEHHPEDGGQEIRVQVLRMDILASCSMNTNCAGLCATCRASWVRRRRSSLRGSGSSRRGQLMMISAE